MGYEAAINKAWDELANANPGKELSVRFLSDEYTIDLGGLRVISLSCNIPVKDFTSILILHYLVKKLKGLPPLAGVWLTFRELSGIEGYYPAFHSRAIEPVIRKYGGNPEGIYSALERLPGKRIEEGDVGVVLEAFAGVPVRICLWRKDEEFAADANIYFDKSITQIFCTEDIVVLAGFIVAKI